MWRRALLLLSISVLLTALVGLAPGCGPATKPALTTATSAAVATSAATAATTQPPSATSVPAASTTAATTSSTTASSATGSTSTSLTPLTVPTAGDPVMVLYMYQLQKWTSTLAGLHADFKDPAHPTTEELAAADAFIQQAPGLLTDLRSMLAPTELRDFHTKLTIAFENMTAAATDYVQAVKSGAAGAIPSAQEKAVAAETELQQAITAVSTAATSTTTLPPGDPMFNEKIQKWLTKFAALDRSAATFKDPAHATVQELTAAGKFIEQVQPLAQELAGIRPPAELRSLYNQFATALANVWSRTRTLVQLVKSNADAGLIASFGKLQQSALAALDQAVATVVPKLVSPQP